MEKTLKRIEKIMALDYINLESIADESYMLCIGRADKATSEEQLLAGGEWLYYLTKEELIELSDLLRDVANEMVDGYHRPFQFKNEYLDD